MQKSFKRDILIADTSRQDRRSKMSVGFLRSRIVADQSTPMRQRLLMSVRLALVMAAIIAGSSILAPAAFATTCPKNSTQTSCACPTAGGGATCFSPTLYSSSLGSCVTDARPCNGDSGHDLWDCTTESCMCDTTNYPCGGCTVATSTVGASCPTYAIGGVYTGQCSQCGCPAGEAVCATTNTCVAPQSCSAGFTWNGCACVTPYVLISPSSQQTGYVNVSGNITSGGLVLPTGAGTGKVLTSDSSGDATWQAPAASGITGMGTANYDAMFTGAGSVSRGQLFENGIGIGINTVNPVTKLSVVGGITAAEGTYGANGGYSFINDGGYDTGMFSPSDGVLDFYDNANHSIDISSSGQAEFYQPAGIGTAPVSGQALTVGTNSIYAGVTAYGNTAALVGYGGTWGVYATNSSVSYGSAAVEAGGAGTGVIGTSGSSLSVSGGVYQAGAGVYGSGSVGVYGSGTYGLYGSGGTYGLYSASGANYFAGRVGVGTTSPSYPIDVQTSVSATRGPYAWYSINGSSTSTGVITGTSSGNISINAVGRVDAQEFDATSDGRLKNVNFNLDSGLALNLLSKLQPVSFNWKDQPDGQPVLGFIAQDVEKSIPNAVSIKSTAKLPDQRMLDYNQITAVAVGAIKALNDRTDFIQNDDSSVGSPVLTVGSTGDLTVSGDISAPNNVWGTTTTVTCAPGTMCVCPNGYYVTGTMNGGGKVQCSQL
jgi:hypothetical protein